MLRLGREPFRLTSRSTFPSQGRSDPSDRLSVIKPSRSLAACAKRFTRWDEVLYAAVKKHTKPQPHRSSLRHVRRSFWRRRNMLQPQFRSAMRKRRTDARRQCKTSNQKRPAAEAAALPPNITLYYENLATTANHHRSQH
jgi:hypothetical protein